MADAPGRWKPNANTPKRKRIYDTPAWKLLRAVVLRLQPICCICHRAPSVEADHILPLTDGGDPFDLANLQGVCKPCHRTKTINDRKQRASRTPTVAIETQLPRG